MIFLLKKQAMILRGIMGGMLWCFSTFVYGADLLQVYQDALLNDPTFKAAESHWRMQREKLPLARAALLPHIVLSADLSHQAIRSKLGQNIGGIVGGNRLTSSSHPYGYGASLEQPLFNLPAWFQLKHARATVKQAHADYLAAAQALILRVAERYFAVLEAKDNLNFVSAEKKAVNQEYQRATARYRQGLSTVTAFYEAKARYDLMTAKEIAARNDESNRIEELREITSHYYDTLKPIDKQLPLLPPKPTSIQQWVYAAQSQNYSLQADREGLRAAHKIIQSSRAHHAPTLSAIGNIRVDKGGDTSTIGASSTEIRSAGIELSLPLFEGGRVLAETRQARYHYQELSNQYEASLRRMITQTRQSYLGVMANISKVKADARVIHSSDSALKANLAGYRAGTRTINDVLDSQANLYLAKKDYMTSLYQYLLNTLRLKQAAGRLGVHDVVTINGWLVK